METTRHPKKSKSKEELVEAESKKMKGKVKGMAFEIQESLIFQKYKKDLVKNPSLEITYMINIGNITIFIQKNF